MNNTSYKEDYKVVYETVDGVRGCTEWMAKKKALKIFNEYKQCGGDVVWAELIYSPLDDDSIDEEQVVDSFTKYVDVIFGQPVVLNVRGK